MEGDLICPSCHVVVRPTDYFCYNCGKNLRPSPLSTSLSAQTALYLKSFFLPPMGIIWGLRYLKQKDSKSQIVGLLAIVVTIISIVIAVKTTIDLIATVNTQINSQLLNF